MADSAQAIIRSTLDRYGLGALASWAWSQFQAGTSFEEIMLEMRSRPEYKNRFLGMETMAKEGRAISEEAWISYENTIRNLVSQYGLPMELYGTREYISDLLVKNISAVEAQSRMQLAAAASTTAPPEYRMAAQRLYGLTPGQFTSIWLETDRTLPVLEKQFAAASIAGEVTIANLGELSQTMAERLVEGGISREQARQGLTRASGQLGVRLPGETEAGLGTDTLTAGAIGFGREREAFERRVRQRIATFRGGGQTVTTAEGAVGLGTTRR